MKKMSVFLIIFVLLFLFISCETDNLPTNAGKSSSVELFENDVEKIEISASDLALLNNYTLQKSSDNEQRDAVVDEVLLKYFAMAVAKSLKHPDICKIIKSKTGEKFDGDYDVLWEQIKNARISGHKMRELVNSRFSDRTKQILSIEMIEEVPLLQVSLPVNFDDWDGESAILVAYTPLTTDDMEWEEIYAYDADLKEHILDAKTEPDFPVMVMGINERSDTSGYAHNADNRISNEEKSIAKSATSRTTGSPEILKYLKIMDDMDPWPSGDADAYIAFGGTNETEKMKNFINIGDREEGHGYYPNLQLFHWYIEQWGEWVGFAVIDQDGGDRNWKATIESSTQCYVRATDNDDTIGYIKNVSFYHSTNETYNYGCVISRMGW